MMQQQYNAQAQYRPAYNASYNGGRPAASYPTQPSPAPYGYNYSQGYNYPQYPAGAAAMYNGAPQGFVAPSFQQGRGRGGFYPPAGRGGFRGGRGFRGGFRGRRGRKPFVGGTLESQREWERQTQCCFFLQGSCKFGETCRFLHEQEGGRQCQFGENCRVHGTRKEEDAEGHNEGESTEVAAQSDVTPTETQQ